MSRHPTAIFRLRNEAKPVLKQSELAAKVGTTRSRISLYETGKTVERMPLVRAMQLAVALGCSVEQVFWGLFETVRAQAGPQEGATTESPEPSTVE